ncbi:MAG: hypothetical protein FJ096_03975 [Deltaproteobacteria bacterium]|nr:hypothetical protein [Deltaproteobacteria bacterium]
MRPRTLLATILLAACATGCGARVNLATPSNAPSVTMNYTGVRTGTRRFADYGVVDRKILKETR